MTEEKPDTREPRLPQKEADNAKTGKRRDKDEKRETPAPVQQITDWAAF